jgi:integrase
VPGHIQDRWLKTTLDPQGKKITVRTTRYGAGLRYRARYVLPDGRERSQSFPDRKKRLAEEWLARISADLSRGQYLDPTAGKVTFKQFSTDWLGSLTTNASSMESVELRVRLHAWPHLGHRPMSSFQPVHIRQWVRTLQDAGLAGSYQRVIFANVSSIFSAAVDDGLIAKNPCRASSVRVPKADPRKVRPWTVDRVLAVRDGLPLECRIAVDLAAGCGLRQGETFGMALDEIDFVAGVVHVVRQVKLVDHRLVFAPPKGDKLREVPLPDSVSFALAEHVTRRPPVPVTLPWKVPDGPAVTVELLLHSRERKAMNRNYFNTFLWKPALVSAGIIEARAAGARYEPSRDHGMHALRHFYASVLLDAGESVKALAEYLGHADPGFTLRTYTHLMPSSPARTRGAVDRAFARTPHGAVDRSPTTVNDTFDGPTTAQDGQTAP